MIKLFSLFSIFFLIYPIVVSSQSYDTLLLKEEFDYYNQLRVYSTAYNPCIANPTKDDGAYGDGMSKILEAYVTMYRTTGDKAYLYKFVHQSMCIVRNRHDISGLENIPRWADQMYRDGYIIAGFSVFIHLIKKDSVHLYTERLYQFEEFIADNFKDGTCFCNFTGRDFLTFGEYAEWLEKISHETMEWYINAGYWEDHTAFKKRPNTDRAVEINMQIGFARALLFLGLTMPNEEYMRKADIVSDLFHSTIRFFDPCDNKYYYQPVFITDTNNAYWWYHRGWDIPKRDCGKLSLIPPGFFLHSKAPNHNAYVRYIEDNSHGVVVTWLPLDYIKYQPNTKFTENDLIRFRNTFAKNLYRDGEFFTGVDGTNGNTWLEVAYKPERLKEATPFGCLSYIVFSPFDGADETASLPNVYNIVMDFYIENVLGTQGLHRLYGGQGNKGHSHMVEIQWQRENTNLHLYNRMLVYNQDFFAKAKLIVDGDSGKTLLSYAEPRTEIRKFIIKSEVETVLTAGEKIVLRNFHAEKGSKVRIHTKTQN